ncbi:MAG: hypothetical protein WDW36_008802 [Sanguina aurantia]
MPTIVKTKKRKVVEEEEAAPAGPANKPVKVKKTKVKASIGEEAEAATSSKPAAPAAAAPGTLTDEEYRKEHDVRVKGLAAGGQLYQHFTDAPFPERLQKCLLSQGFKAPSPIQAQGWPAAMTGRDVLAIAKTGSGKTCGYLLPAMARVLDGSSSAAAAPASAKPFSRTGPAASGVSILIMAPTRELACQIQEQAAMFGASAGLRTVAVYGGAPKGPQIRDLRAGAQVVVATPGRLLDLMECKGHDGKALIGMSGIKVLVLDEADRMCDMGFEADIKKVVAEMPNTKQTLFFTATWPKSVQRVAASLMNNPIQINIGNSDQLAANKDVTQHVKIVRQGDKYEALVALLKAEVAPDSRTLIFCNKKYLCDEIEKGLWEAGYSVGTIHGDKSQQEREWALAQIRSGAMPLLVATDVAARGLDIKGMDRVINYDFPRNVEDFVHRIGRTGRAGASGIANTFFSPDDSKHAKELCQILRAGVAARGGGYGGRGGGYGGRGGGGRGGGGGRRW